jgi:pimeloyl-ACP methyl ester carboxylesterase
MAWLHLRVLAFITLFTLQGAAAAESMHSDCAALPAQENNLQPEPPSTKSIKSSKHKKQILAGVIASLVAVPTLCVASAFLAQGIATQQDQKKYPAPGSFIEVDGKRVHYRLTGNQGPTIIGIAGLGGNSLDWSPLLEAAKQMPCRFLVYDRLNTGWSDARKDACSVEYIAHELHALIQALQIKGPYILMGHSLGGVYAHAYRRLYPGQAACSIMLDAPHPSFWCAERNKPALEKIIADYPAALRIAAYAGITRFIDDKATNFFSGDERDRYASLQKTGRYAANLVEEYRAADAYLKTWHAQSAEKAGSHPLLVITSPHYDKQHAVSWDRGQKNWLRESSCSQLVKISGGHYMQRTNPAAVAALIEALLASRYNHPQKHF